MQKIGKENNFFFKISENGGGLKTDSQDDFPFDFFCYFSVFITDLCFLMTNTIFRFFSIFLKNCSEICSFSGIGQFPHFFHFCVKMKINMSIRVKNEMSIAKTESLSILLCFKKKNRKEKLSESCFLGKNICIIFFEKHPKNIWKICPMWAP